MNEQSHQGDNRINRRDFDERTNSFIGGSAQDADRWGDQSVRGMSRGPQDRDQDYRMGHLSGDRETWRSRSMGGSFQGESMSSSMSRGQYAGRGPKGYQRSDERVKEEVCDILTRDHDVDASDIEVQVHNGEVTLSGMVSDRNQKRRAEDVIERMSGVKEIHNQIRVQAPQHEAASSDMRGLSMMSSGQANPQRGAHL